MFIVSIIFLVLSIFIVLGNWTGIIGASRNKARGINKGFSCIPFFSILFSLLSWLTGREWMGLWPFLPTVLDPATWPLVFLPLLLWREFRRNK